MLHKSEPSADQLFQGECSDPSSEGHRELMHLHALKTVEGISFSCSSDSSSLMSNLGCRTLQVTPGMLVIGSQCNE